jgi:aspartate 1-decarboxylase
MAHEGDLVIIISYAQMGTKKARAYVPTVVHVDAQNHLMFVGSDPAEAVGDDVQRPPLAV